MLRTFCAYLAVYLHWMYLTIQFNAILTFCLSLYVKQTHFGMLPFELELKNALKILLVCLKSLQISKLSCQ